MEKMKFMEDAKRKIELQECAMSRRRGRADNCYVMDPNLKGGLLPHCFVNGELKFARTPNFCWKKGRQLLQGE